MKKWHFITNHGCVFLYISHNPQCTMREMAAALGGTERSIKRIIKDLEQKGYVTWEGTGKENCYQINNTCELKHELTKDVIVVDLLDLLGKKKRSKTHWKIMYHSNISGIHISVWCLFNKSNDIRRYIIWDRNRDMGITDTER